MSKTRIRYRCPRTSALGALAALSIFSTCAVSSGVVSAGRDSLPLPSNGYIGWWNGSTGVCVGPHWVLSAGHVGGDAGGTFWMRGVAYHAAEVIHHPTQDVELIRVQETLPGFHLLTLDAQAGDVATIGGLGNTAGNELWDGYDWTGAQQETWGQNVIDNDSWLVVINFSAPGTTPCVPHESIFAVHDSGAGLFVQSPDGSLRLAGLCVGASGLGSSLYGDNAFCVNAGAFSAWMMRAQVHRVTLQDVFDFLSSYFAGSPGADFNQSGMVTVQDIFDILNAYFTQQ